MSRFLSRMRFSRDHRWAPGHMSDYLDGGLAPSRRRRMERHVGDCPECGRLLAALHRMMDALHRAPPPVAAADAAQIAEAVRRRLQEPPSP